MSVKTNYLDNLGGVDTRTRYGLNAAALVYTAILDSLNTE